MQLVYYSLNLNNDSNDSHRITQLLRSIQSLRQHNKDIPVQVHLLGKAPDGLGDQLQLQSVKLVYLDSYETVINNHLDGFGEFLSLYPVLHKFLTMSEIPDSGYEQVLYLDSDTYIHRDIEQLFATYGKKDIYAREEPWTRRSHLAYKPDYIDEDKLQALAAMESSRPPNPFNTGVILMNNRVWEKLMLLAPVFISFVVRFTLWILKNCDISPDSTEAVYLSKYPEKLPACVEELEPLPFPGTNYWIREQLALWYTVGKLKDVECDLFLLRHVLQGCEEVGFPGRFTRPIISHYYSRNTQTFFSKLYSNIYKE